ncbi:MAG: 6-carboxytetrahydropterin synthase, partial [Nitrosopumilaceae archaeon]|jgi:6-pyruvoyltetrahydropterin/6-carboxytetrahydropterin synthase
MASSPTVLDSDFRYIDKKGNLMRTRTELTVAQMLAFLEEDYQYDHELILKDGKKVRIDFKTSKGLIEVIDNENDITKYKQIKDNLDEKVMAIGHPKYSAQIKELEDIVFYDKTPQTGSIFLEDASFSFDYAHILPLVEKCSILHGHTSSVMVELVGQMKDNLLVDFGVAKKIIKEVVNVFDHKFFINEKYLKSQDDSHYQIQFEGPKGMFDLQVPKNTTYLLKGEATVENLSSEIIKLLAPKMPPNVEAVGVYIYEGYNKGSHIISNISR